MVIMRNNKVLLIIPTKFDVSELIDNLYFSINGKTKKYVSGHSFDILNVSLSLTAVFKK